MDDAVKELQASLEARDSAVVANDAGENLPRAEEARSRAAEVQKALKLAPNYAEAKQLLEHLQNYKASEKKPGGGAQ